jgi:hypothetical protein
MYDVGPHLPRQANHPREGVSYAFGFQVVKRDIGRYVFQERTCRLDQGQMGLEARAVQVLKERRNHSLRSPATEGRHEKQNSFAR